MTLFAVSCDSAATNCRFAKTLDLEDPVLSDPEKEIATAWGVDHDGQADPERRTVVIVVDGTILDVIKEVDSQSHGAQIAERLEALGGAQRCGLTLPLCSRKLSRR